MPQGIATHIPFPSRTSPDADRAAACHLVWPRAFGLLPTAHAEHRHVQGAYPDLAARFYPAATGADLDLGVDQMSWFFVFDDRFDGACGSDPQRARQFTDAVAAVVDRSPAAPPSADTPGIVRAFADIWARSCAGMSPAWHARAAASWRSYIAGHVAEAVNRTRDRPPAFTDQLALRRETSGVYPILDLGERLGGYELPERVHGHRVLSEMRRLSAEVVVLDNEIFSLEKEERIGDRNLILTMQHDGDCSRPAALATVCAMIRERTERFAALEDLLPALSDELRLDDTERSALRRYDDDALRTVMRGAHDWQRHSVRYSAAYLPPAEPLVVDQAGR